ncbi:MAG TPA: hypothetical protein ENK14_13010 [Caldithrix sp.]|nr:hypothetical protein [Caldithrix sp.]
MAKAKKSRKQKTQPIQTISEDLSLLEKLEQPRAILGFFILLFVLLAILYKPLVFEGKDPSGSDIVTGIGKTHQMKMWQQKTGHYPLWNPAMFCGMPAYFRFGAKVWSFDTLLNKLDFLGDWRLWYFLAGALGMFFLIKFLGLSAAAGMLAALAFVFMPHFQALIIVGHFSKFRALMWMPYVLLTALLLIRRRDILSALLFALVLALQFRTQHYQIMFYTLIAILFMGIPPLYRMLKEKQFAATGKLLGLTFAAGMFTLLIVSQNLLSIKEYTPYSTRGGHAISIRDTGETHQEKKGVGFDYATNWSYSVSEWWNLIVPKFHGGTSNEVYTGGAVPVWKNRQLPTYWGSMPFTQSYEYLGILLVFLALIAVIFQWSRWEVKSLTFLTAFALLLSLGKHFSLLYKPLFIYLPYFDKFRVPMMVLTLVMFTTALLAAYGLSFLLKMDFGKKELMQKFYIFCGIFAAFLLIPLLFGGSFSLTHAGEIRRYGQDTVANLKKVRLDLLRTSSLVSLLFLLAGISSVFAVAKGWLRRAYLPFVILAMLCIDLFVLDSHYVKGKFTDTKIAEQRHYGQTAIDNVLQKDHSLFRVLPLDNVTQDTRWSYAYQSVGGYSPAKMQTFQEIVDNCLIIRDAGSARINWNVVNMLNAKYIISNQKLPFPNLQLVASNPQPKQYAFQNSGVLPRAFFVDSYRVIKDGVERLKFLNSPEFDPARIAVLEEEPDKQITQPDSFRINVKYQPEHVSLNVYTDKTALLVLSEMYYPPGWTATLDDNQDLHIFKTNHLLRSVVVPQGDHAIEFNFHPKSYYAGLRISLVSLLVTYLLILIFGYIRYSAWLIHLFEKRGSRGK